MYMSDYTLAEALYLEANQCLEAGDLAEAKRLLEEVLRLEPGYGKAHNFMGWLYHYHFGDHERAEAYYERALRFDTRFPASYLNYLELLTYQRRLDEAATVLAAAQQVSAMSANWLNYYEAFLLELSGDLKAALRGYRHAMTLCDDDQVMAIVKQAIARVQAKRKSANILFQLLF